jgi:hypothetical protein
VDTIGPIAIIFVIVVAIPIGVFISCGVLAGILGHFLKKDVEDEFVGTEYVDLS